MISLVDLVVLVVLGAVAGLVGSAGGITSLVSYPALLLVGLPARTAAVTQGVALAAFLPGSALGSRPELRGRAAWLAGPAVVAAVGGGVGAGLLLVTSADVFARVVPFLVLAGALTLLFEPRLRAWRARRMTTGEREIALPLGLVVLSVYNGYFGAGSGVMLLTLLLVLVEPHLPTANALKNVLVGVSGLITAMIFAVSGPVNWPAALALGAGLLGGTRIGPTLARRLPVGVLRRVIVLLGLVLAAELWWNPAT